MFRSCFSRPLLGATMALVVAGCTVGGNSFANSSVEPLLPEAPFRSDTSYRMYNALLAEMLVRDGQLKRAAQHYMLATTDSRDIDLLQRATEVALEADEPLLAEEMLSRWAKQEPDSLKVHQYRILLNAQLGNYDAAVDDVIWLQEAVDKSEGYGFEFVLQLLALETGQRNTYEVLHRYAEKVEASTQVQLAVATFALSAEHYEEALAATAVVKEKGDDAQKEQAIRLSYRALLALGREDEAISTLQPLVAETDDTKLKIDYGRLLIMADRRDEARPVFQQLYAAQPDNADILYTLGLLYLEQAEYAFAEPLLKKLLDRPGRKYEASYFLGQVYEGQDRTKEALDAYDAALNGDFARESLMHKARLLEKTQGLVAARTWLQTFAKETTDSVQKVRSLMAEGELLHGVGDYKQAIDLYTQAESLGGDKHNLLYARSLSYERMGDIDAAEQDLRAILQEAPEDADSLNALGYMLTVNTERYTEARQLIKKAIEIKPNSPAIMDSIGWVEFKLGHLAESEKWLRKAFTIMPDPEVASHLIEVLGARGKTDEARTLLQDMLSKHPDDKMLVELKKRLVDLSSNTKQ